MASDIVRIVSIGQHHQAVGLPKPEHPLVSILRFEDFPRNTNFPPVKFTLDFYTVTIKNHCECKVKYGQTHYDFDEGVMSFMAPQQVMRVEGDRTPSVGGWLLMFHADFIRHHPLGKKIKDYGFFDYSMNESLILSEKEQVSVESIFQGIEKEYRLPIDSFSQDVIVSQLELLLTYSNRYYHRQFITRKTHTNDLLSSMEAVLTHYLNDTKIEHEGLPSVTYLAGQLHLSPKYLSDMLRALTGQSAQQHIHNKLIERAKEQLSTTELSVGEIAYQLGFEYPQSFSKLFKNKTTVSPSDFRNSFN